MNAAPIVPPPPPQQIAIRLSALIILVLFCRSEVAPAPQTPPLAGMETTLVFTCTLWELNTLACNLLLMVMVTTYLSRNCGSFLVASGELCGLESGLLEWSEAFMRWSGIFMEETGLPSEERVTRVTFCRPKKKM